MNNNVLTLASSSLFLLAACQLRPQIKNVASARWTDAQAQQWSTENGWLRGCNFNPSTAINQLETWQAESFDTTTINRELGWAQEIGMNVVRVYLHRVDYCILLMLLL